MPVSRKEAARHLLKLRQMNESFAGFCAGLREAYTPPEFLDQPVPAFHQDLIKILDRVELGEVNRALITMPPRHLKSTFSSQLLPAYFMARNPRRQIIQVTYGETFAQDFGTKVQSLIKNPLVQQAFPDVRIDPSVRSRTAWMTEAGGTYFAVGVGGAVTGRGANLLIIDDPIKNREEAESASYRNTLWQEYIATLSTRLLHDGRILLIQTRWHPDDLAGRLMNSSNWKSEGWVHYNFPAIKEVETDLEQPRWHLPKDDPRYITLEEARKIDRRKRYIKAPREVALWPEVFPLDRLKRQQSLDEREFAALYQQSPYIQGGNMIRENWWRTYNSHVDPETGLNMPSNVRIQSILIGVDTAFKAREYNDPSAMVVLGIDTLGDIYVLEVHVGRYEFPDLKRVIMGMNMKYRGRGLMGVYIEDRASGQSLIQELRRESGIAVIPHKVTADKVVRARGVLPMLEGGRVFIPRDAEWLDPFMQECLEFPNSKHDDQVDALVIALDAASKIAMANHNSFGGPINMETALSRQLDQAGFSFDRSGRGHAFGGALSPGRRWGN